VVNAVIVGVLVGSCLDLDHVLVSLIDQLLPIGVFLAAARATDDTDEAENEKAASADN
jgi:hypothetical protein